MKKILVKYHEDSKKKEENYSVTKNREHKNKLLKNYVYEVTS